jgi:hypothetical protein
MSCDCYNKYINDLAEQKRVAKNNRWKFYANEMEMWRKMNRKPKPIPDAYWCDICIAPLLDEEFELQMKQDKVRNIFLKHCQCQFKRACVCVCVCVAARTPS